MSNEKVVINRFPFFAILALIFITLKLTGHIEWSWWWVLAPIWGPLAIISVILGILGIVFTVVYVWENK